MVVLTGESYLNHPYPFLSSVCTIEERFVFLRSGTGFDSARVFASNSERHFQHGRIVRAGFNHSDLFALALTLYFPTALVLAIDFDRFRRFDPEWIDAAVAKVLGGGEEAVAAQVRDGVASHAILARASTLRRFLTYTDVRYSAVPAIAVFSRWIPRVCEVAGRHDLEPVPEVSGIVKPAPMKCPSDEGANSSDVVAVIPSFKRDYMAMLVNGLVRQTKPPARIIILQNAMHVLLNFSAMHKVSRSVPIFHVWCTNWNSFFFLTYVLMSFVPERFVLKIDDDLIPTDWTSLATFLRTAERPNVIVGQGRTTLNRRICKLKPVIIRDTGVPDHVAFVVLFDARAGKVLARFRPLSLLGGEDISISVVNAMECGTANVQVKFPVRTFQRDGNTHRRDKQISAGYEKLGGTLFDPMYCYFIEAGYRPILWRNFSVGKPRDIRLPY
jgi:hypothetical protein